VLGTVNGSLGMGVTRGLRWGKERGRKKRTGKKIEEVELKNARYFLCWGVVAADRKRDCPLGK